MFKQKEYWASRTGLILAMAGNAVGLGNFLRFPAQAVHNGGGAFIIPYLVSFLVMGLPLLYVEWAIGRHGGRFGHHQTTGMFYIIGGSRIWWYIGILGVFNCLAVATYYLYIESWTLAYAFYSVSGVFGEKTLEEISVFFSSYLGTVDNSIISISSAGVFFFIVTLILNVWILSRGLNKGIEVASKIGMPLLILFAVFLAVRAFTLDEGEYGAVNDAIKGLNFLWEPQFDSLTNPKIWLAAAGQVFFTLSLGMGSIHCYASYLKENHDIALNASAAGWLNEAVEVILGGSIIIPIAVAYLGVDWIQQHVGFEMGFRTMPFLFQQWGPVRGAIAGLLWFGLLFFAGITSSLAMGQPVLAFLQDAFKIQRKPSALIFGGIVLFLATPCVLFYSLGSFDEFDYWVGTFSLVLLALTESILFAWVFGMKKGWVEITRGADIVLPDIFCYILKYVTPVFLIMVFTASLIKPEGGNWASALTILRDSGSWTFAPDSVIGNLLHYGIQDTRWFINGVPTKLFITDATRLLLTIVFLIIGMSTVKIALNNDNNTVKE